MNACMRVLAAALLLPFSSCETWSLAAEQAPIDLKAPVEELPIHFRASVGGRF